MVAISEEAICAVSNILVGPTIIIAFEQPDFFGTFLFFGCLWHFLVDTEATRPSHVLVVPWRTKGWYRGRRRILMLQWFRSWLTLVHHFMVDLSTARVSSGNADGEARTS